MMRGWGGEEGAWCPGGSGLTHHHGALERWVHVGRQHGQHAERGARHDHVKQHLMWVDGGGEQQGGTEGRAGWGAGGRGQARVVGSSLVRIWPSASLVRLAHRQPPMAMSTERSCSRGQGRTSAIGAAPQRAGAHAQRGLAWGVNPPTCGRRDVSTGSSVLARKWRCSLSRSIASRPDPRGSEGRGGGHGAAGGWYWYWPQHAAGAGAQLRVAPDGAATEGCNLQVLQGGYDYMHPVAAI